jgi:hypothetical protein
MLFVRNKNKGTKKTEDPKPPIVPIISATTLSVSDRLFIAKNCFTTELAINYTVRTIDSNHINHNY